MNKLLILCFVFIAGCSCSKEEEVKPWLGTEVLEMVKLGDPNVVIKLPSKESEVIRCDQYQPPCKTSHLYIIKDLEAIFLEYNNEEEAKKAAKYINGYYSNNWVFDDVSGEPILERFVIEHLKAVKP